MLRNFQRYPISLSNTLPAVPVSIYVECNASVEYNDNKNHIFDLHHFNHIIEQSKFMTAKPIGKVHINIEIINKLGNIFKQQKLSQ